MSVSQRARWTVRFEADAGFTSILGLVSRESFAGA